MERKPALPESQTTANIAVTTIASIMGGVATFSVSNPLFGIFVGSLVQASIKEFISIQLTSTGYKRLEDFWATVVRKVHFRQNKGEKINSQLFDSKDGTQFSLRDVYASAIMKALWDAEDKKRKYYASFIANLSFEDSLDLSRSILMVDLIYKISYRQLCLLVIFNNNAQNLHQLRDKDYRKGEEGLQANDLVLIALLQEVVELNSLNLLQLPNDTILGLTDVCLAKMIILPTGKELIRLMSLDEIAPEDIQPSINLLKASRKSRHSQ